MAKHLEPVSVPSVSQRQPATLVALAAGGLIMPLTEEARLRGLAIRLAHADAFARSMASTIAALEREGITSSKANGQSSERARRTDSPLQALGRLYGD